MVGEPERKVLLKPREDVQGGASGQCVARSKRHTDKAPVNSAMRKSMCRALDKNSCIVEERREPD